MAKTKFNVYTTTHGTGTNVSSFFSEDEAKRFARRENKKPDTLKTQVWRGKR